MNLKKETKILILIVSIFCTFVVLISAAVVLMAPRVINSFITAVDDTEKAISVRGGILAEIYPAREDGTGVTSKDLNAIKEIMDNRLEHMGIKSKTLRVETNKKRISVKFALKKPLTGDELNELLKNLTKKGLLTFQEVDVNSLDSDGNYRPTGKIIVTGADIKKSEVSFDSNGSIAVSISFTSEGKSKLAEATSRLVGQPIAIFMDDEPLLDSDGTVNSHAPVVRQAITGGEATIDGQKSAEEAGKLAAIISSGSMPCRLQVKNLRIRSPK